MPGPIFLEGETVSLRPIEQEDLEFLQTEINRREIWRRIGRPQPVNADQEEEFYENVVCSDDHTPLLLTVDGEPAGTLGFNDYNHEHSNAELGYWVAPDYQRNGHATEGVSLLLDYGFEERNLHRVEARVFEFNTASQRLLESLGFTKEGIHRDAHFARGEYQDVFWYGLLEDEWE